MELPERKRRILKAIVENYIETAEPVGSKTLADSFDVPISSATIRNEMSELEEMGYLEKPHVSAGRIPSYAAYRLYVNELMERQRVATGDLEAMRLMMQSKMREIDNIMISATKVVSEMTRHTAVSMIAHQGGAKIKKCELITVDGGSTYAVVLVTESDVKNRMIRLSQPVEPSTAAMLNTAINLAISENRLAYLLPSVAQGMGNDSPIFQLITQVMDFIRETEQGGGKSEVYIDGAARLLDNREYQDTQRAQELLEYFSDRSRVSQLLDGDTGNLINVRIGPELRDPSVRDASLVFTSYPIDENTRGVVGIIAPARMDYADVCAKLAAFVQAISGVTRPNMKQLKDTGETDERRNEEPGNEGSGNQDAGNEQ
ncbi:MAG: heat-inducible transcriptional repressor HrcA [Clostridia bacterium]|nr:heat-inducible transcriptional repressor HrcA [Clostridia bacterium]MDD7672494.1 heat-inducible transcriptional repressor HrcA [Clostridia bacterium]MDY2928817.1 heat-inducible transcriptional repressor HrcA [Clostridiaceae bacterium]